MFIVCLVPQATVKPCATTRFRIRNQGTRIWFEHEIDLMDKNDNGLETMSNEITDRHNKFAFLVFKKLKEETGSELKGNGGTKPHADIKGIHDRACAIKDGIRREHRLHDSQAGEYEGQVPAIRVSVLRNVVHVTSDNWFDMTVGKVGTGAKSVDQLYCTIKERFGIFGTMIRCQLGREINKTLWDMERAFFRDKWLIDIKTNFDQSRTVPLFELKRWVKRTSTKACPSGACNPDYIPGMGDLACKNLTIEGFFAQTCVTKTLHEGRKLKVLGVENKPYPLGINPDTKKEYDVDILLEDDGKKIPVQVGVRKGELALKVSDATVCPGEETRPNEAVSKLGGTNMDYGKKQDFDTLCSKLKQVPPGGIVLWVSQKELLPGSGPTPLKEWYGEIMDKKCVIVWVADEGKATIHHNNTKFDQNLAKKTVYGTWRRRALHTDRFR